MLDTVVFGLEKGREKMFKTWTVVSTCDWDTRTVAVSLALLKTLVDALEYAVFVKEYDEGKIGTWTTFVVEGNFLYS